MKNFPDLFFSSLDFLLEKDGIDFIFIRPDGIFFKTILGSDGFISVNETGDYEVKIGQEIIYTMEKSVYDLINFDASPPPLPIYVPLLLLAWNSSLHTKSKLIIGKILNSLFFLESQGYIDLELQEYGNLSIIPNLTNHK